MRTKPSQTLSLYTYLNPKLTTMTLCPHTQWVDLAGIENSTEWFITYGQRLHTVLDDLPSPETQYPTTFFFLGKRAKVIALKSIFSNNNTTRRKGHGIATLHLDTATAGSTYPVLFADCYPGADCTNQLGKWNGCHDTRRYRINQGDEELFKLKELVDKIHTRLLFNFVDVICIFAEDLGGDNATAEHLLRWTKCGRPTQRPPSHRPCVMVVVPSKNDCRDILQIGNSSLFRDHFESLVVVDMDAYAGLSVLAALLSLKEILRRHADRVRGLRVEMRALYNAEHLKAFFMAALKDFADDPFMAFDFIKSSKREEQDQQLPDHLRRFILFCLQQGVPENLVSIFIASALLMNCYPMGMHRTLLPCMCFPP